MEDNEFWELETPILYKSTPEGAKEFLVPTSSRPGQFYALPQSPQTFKQLYAIAGYERYYQIARCFRDEATRADRTQEFTQLDIEMAFLDPDELFGLMEALFARIWSELLRRRAGHAVPAHDLGRGHPPLRLRQARPALRRRDLGRHRPAGRHRVQGLPGRRRRRRGGARPGRAAVPREFSRKDFDDLVEFAKGWGGKGVAWLQLQAGGEIRSPIAKFLSQAELAGIVERIGAGEGDTVFLVADARGGGGARAGAAAPAPGRAAGPDRAGLASSSG